MSLSYYTEDLTLRFDPATCKACGRCGDVCPHGVFSFPAKGLKPSVEPSRCIECGACKRNCPFGAIEVQAGVGCASALINVKLGKTKTACC